MSGWIKCSCEKTQKEKRNNWVVIHRNHNHSYFESPKGAEHYSDYSEVVCTKCSGSFRTKANYVDELPNGRWNGKKQKWERE
jgi:hypothetical protein